MKRNKIMKKRILAAFLAFVLVVTGLHITKSEADKVKAAETVTNTDMLSIKMQTRKNTDDTIDLRIVSSVDSLNYKEVGFLVWYGDAASNPTDNNVTATFTTTKVLERIQAGVSYAFSPQVIDTSSKYFIAGTLKGILEDHTGKNFYIKAFCTPIGGTTADRVYGVGRFFNIDNATAEGTINIPIKMAATTGATLTNVTVAGTTTQATVAAYLDGYAHLNVTVPSGYADKTALPSASIVAVGTNKTIYRNLESKLKVTESGSTVTVTGDDTWITKYLELYPSETEFVVANAADLYGLASYSQDKGLPGKTIYLIADIDANDGVGTATENGFTRSDEKTPYPWKPIGHSNYKFQATFDGNMHTISGVFLETASNYRGLFAATYNATIQNFKLENSYISTTAQYVGSVVGTGCGSLSNIYSNAVVRSNQAIQGGIIGHAGYISDSREITLTIENCWFDGEIINTHSEGSHDYANVGGILGQANHTVNMKDCLYTGNIDTSAMTTSKTGGNAGLVGVNNGTLSADSCAVLGTLSRNKSNHNVYAHLGQGSFTSIKNLYATNVNGNENSTNTQWSGNFTGSVPSGGTYTAVSGSVVGSAARTSLLKLDWVENWRAIDGKLPMQKVFAEDYVDTDWYDGHENSTNYALKSRQDLYGLAALVNAGITFEGKTIQLANDIVINETDVSKWETTTPKYNWEPIGISKDLPFKGIFHGNGYSISGLYLNATTRHNGLFGVAYGATIKNLKLTNSYIASTDQWVGSIVGRGNGTFENLYSDATVKNASAFTGGLFGQLEDTTSSLTKCWFDGTVISTSNNDRGYVGGLIGYAAHVVTLTDCLNTGHIDITGTNNANANGTGAGGFIGINANSVTMNHCAMLGTIKADGKNGFCAMIGIMDHRGLSGSNLYIMKDRWTTAHTNFQSNYPGAVISGVSLTNVQQAEVLGAKAKTKMPNLDWANTWRAVDGELPMLKMFAKEYVDTDWYDENTDAASYTLKTRQDLYGLAVLVNGGISFEGKTIELANDIAINESNILNFANETPEYHWEPIGTASSPFKGTFNGNGYYIRGLYMNVTTSICGLFGQVSGATIKNLKLTNSYIAGYNNVGSIAGKGSGTFTNIYSDAFVRNGFQFGGGIIGETNANTVISKCWFDGTAQNHDTDTNKSGGFDGGIVGYVSAGTTELTDCYSSGYMDIQGIKYNSTYAKVGGLVGVVAGGTNLKLTDCVSVCGLMADSDQIPAYTVVGYHDSNVTASGVYARAGIKDDNCTSWPGGYGNGLGAFDYTKIDSTYKGSAAATQMSALDFTNTWKTTSDWPILRGLKDEALFSDDTDVFAYHNVPKMVCVNATFSEPEDFGNGDWRIKVTGSTTAEYKAYLRLLKNYGFEKHSDNGTGAMEGYVYTSSHTKDGITLTVSHEIKQNCTYLVASYNEALSPHLIYQDDYMNDVISGAKTTLHMMELHQHGNSFIFQLKNGNFVIYDGGQDIDAPYLLDYLEDLTPGDEKPVIEAWFFSHGHFDHIGSFMNTYYKQVDLDRISVRGVYFTAPDPEQCAAMDETEIVDSLKLLINAHERFVDDEGNPTKFYRMHLGQRYYFCGLTIDVPLTIEQIEKNAYANSSSLYNYDFNDTSTWLMAHIDGQKFLCGGDANYVSQQEMMKRYDKSYFNLDVFAVLHHGINVRNDWTDYCTLKTVLYTSWREASIWSSRSDLAATSQNQHLRDSCEEYVSFGGGMVVLTFPYTVGTYELQEKCDWRYNNGSPVREDL